MVTRGQRGHQLFELAAFAFPADPRLLAATVFALAVQQNEARHLRPVAGHRMARIDRADLLHRVRQQGFIPGRMFGGGVGPVAQQRELRVELGVGQPVQDQPVHQAVDGGCVGDHRRDHDHHPVFRRNAVDQRQTRQLVRSRRLADQAVDDRHGHFRGRQQREQGDQRRDPGAVAGRAAVTIRGQDPGHQCPGAQHYRTQVQR